MKYQKYLDKHPLDLKDKTILITGASCGLGFEYARISLYYNLHLFMAVRSLSRGEDSKARLLEEFPNAQIDILTFDQADKDSINELVNKVKDIHLDYFLFNAGSYKLAKSIRSKEDYNIIIATNTLGPIRIIEGLKDYFKEHKTTLIVTNSLVRSLVKIKDGITKDIYYPKTNQRSYSLSKRYLMDYVTLTSNKYKELKFINMAPGISGTNLLKQSGSGLKHWYQSIGTPVMSLIGNKPEKSALILVLALDPKRNNLDYIVPKHFFHIKGYPKQIKTPQSGVTYLEGLESLI